MSQAATATGPAESPVPPGSPVPTVAELDRRFYAFTVDRSIAWTIDGVAAFLLFRVLIEAGHVVAGVAAIVAIVLLVGAAFAVVLGLFGTSPGMGLVGIRVVSVVTGEPVGVGPALLRQLVLGAATLPTVGLGAATLAWTAVTDVGGRRRGWHDHLAHSVVVDVRPVQVANPDLDVQPRHVVNLTAMRLVPAPQPPPISTPPRSARPPSAPPQPPPPEPAAPRRPRQQLGYPLVPDAAPPGGGPVPADRWRVLFDSGDTVVVEGLALVGRRPEPRAGEPVRHLVPLTSADMSLSKTHAQLQLAPDGSLVVTDRGSTNGSILIRQGVARELTVGRPATLLDGDVVRFGDREMVVARMT